MAMHSAIFKGFLLALTAGTSWGSMAVAAQYLMTHYGFSAENLTALRVFGAGLALAMIDCILSPRNHLKTVFKWENLRDIAIYGLGVLGIQWAFFLSIEHANAATAGILVLTGPLFVISFLAFIDHRKVQSVELGAIGLSAVGVICLITKGDFSQLNFSSIGVFWGLVSAICGAFCTIQPRQLIKRVSVTTVVGWGMLIGGAVGCVVINPFDMAVDWNFECVALYGYIVLFGTIIAFWCYLKSLEFVPPSITSILNCFEPLSAVLLSVIILGTSFQTVEVVGALLIFSTVFLLTKAKF